MSYRNSEGWQTDTTSVFSNGPDQLPTQAPQHPIATMQGAFEESMMETLQDGEEAGKDVSKMDAVARRRMLLESPQYERTVAGRWKQKSGENFHPLWKLVAQVSFGMHLLHQGLAKSDEEVIKILQTHVDDVDGFLERTTEDLDLAQRDIEERIRYLKLPLEHGDVFDNMLGDRKFRNAILEGNEKIEHIVDRTGIQLRDTLKDVKKGYDGTRELSRYFRKLDSTWENQTEEHMGVYAAMMGNTEGWTGAYLELQKKGDALHASLVELSGIIAEIQRRVGIASRKNLKPSAPTSRSSTQPPSRATSIYNAQSTPQSPTKPHISNAIGTGMRNRHPSQRTPNERWADSYAGDRYRRPSTSGTGAEPSSSGHQRRGSDDSTNKRVSFSERSFKRLSGDSWRESNGHSKRESKRESKSKSGDGLKTSWFRKSSAESSTSSLKDKRKSQSNPSLTSPPLQTPYDPETGVRTTRGSVSKPTPRETPNSATSPNVMSPMRMSETVGVQPSTSFSRRPPREQPIADDAIEEVTEDEAESEEEPEPEIIEVSKVEQKPAENLTTAKEIKIPTPSNTTPQKPTLRDLPLRNYKSTDSLPEGREAEQKAMKHPQPNLQSAVHSLRRSASLTAALSTAANDGRRGSEPINKPEPLRVSTVSSFAPFARTPTGNLSHDSAESASKPTTPRISKRPANLKLFPTIPPGRTMSPGPRTAPLDKTMPLFPGSPVTERHDQAEKLPKMPQTPAERGRSPPPPERVPTPPQDKHSVSPSLKALTSATVSGPEPDFPFGFGEEDDEEPFIAELSARPPTADGERDSSIERTAELGTESPAIRQPKTSPWLDPEEQRAEQASKAREREARLTAEKRRVQEQIMSKVMEQSGVTDLEKPRREEQYPTGDTRQLHAPPIVSPPSGPSPYPKHSPLDIAASTTSLTSGPNYNLPYSKHNPTPLKERRFPWRRLFRFGRSAATRNASVDTAMLDGETASMGGGEPSNGKRRSGRKLFGIPLSLGKLTHRRNRSKDLRINTNGGLQPFGFWAQDNQGMSWGDTSRASDSAKGTPAAAPTEDAPDRQPTVTPRPDQGTMSIPGVGTIDFSRASTYVKLEKEKQAQLQSLLQQQQDREEAERQKKEEEEELTRLVAQRKEQFAQLEKEKEDAARRTEEQASESKTGEVDESKDDEDDEDEQDQHDEDETASTKSSFELNLPKPEISLPKMDFPRVDYPKVNIPRVVDPIRHPLTDDSMISPTTIPWGSRQIPPAATSSPSPSRLRAEDSASATAADSPVQRSSAHHSPKTSSDASATSDSRSNRESSQRKSDATPNTGLSLMLSPSLGGDMFSNGNTVSTDSEDTADTDKTQTQQESDQQSTPQQDVKSPAGQSSLNSGSTLQSLSGAQPSPAHSGSAHQSPTTQSQPWHPKRTSSLTSSAASPVDRAAQPDNKLLAGGRVAIGARSPALGADVNPIDSKMGAPRDQDALLEDEEEAHATPPPPEDDESQAVNGVADDDDDADEQVPQKREGLLDVERPLSDGSEPMSPSFLDAVPRRASFLDREPVSMDAYVRDPIRERNGTPF